MKIVVIGTRGIPGIQGGVETHCENLYPRIAAMGHDVTVIRRSCYINDSNRLTEYKGVKLIDVYAPRKKSLEAIVHTALAVIRARRLNPVYCIFMRSVRRLCLHLRDCLVKGDDD